MTAAYGQCVACGQFRANMFPMLVCINGVELVEFLLVYPGVPDASAVMVLM